MSTIATTNIKHASSSSNNIVLTSDGKANIPGHIIQVVQTTKTDVVSISTTMNGSAGFTDISGMSVSITPASSSNKILIMTTGRVSSTNHVYVRLMRGSTPIAIGDAEGSNRTRASTGELSSTSGNHNQNANIIWLDSPSTTSSTTYKMQIACASTAYFNRPEADSDHIVYSRSASAITVMEVAA